MAQSIAETGEIVYNECIYATRCTTITLQSFHLLQSHCILNSPARPFPVYTYYSRLISNRDESLLSAEEA